MYEKIVASLDYSIIEANGDNTEFMRGYYTALMDVVTQIPLEPHFKTSLALSSAILAFEKLNFVNLLNGDII